MVTPRFPVALALLLAAANFPMAPAAEAQSSGKNSSGLEEHYETLPPDVEPGSEVEGPAGHSSLPEVDPRPAPRTSPHKSRTNGGDGNRDGNDQGAFKGRDSEDREHVRDTRPGGARRDTVPDDGDDIADVSYFYDTLDSGGAWITHPRFGDVWRPTVGHDWRPYTLGRWAYSDDFGWTWISDEPFGWAVYHYGRWSFGRDDGWVWIPGTEWGPAWVAWRHGEEAIGWAPLPPNARFEQGRMAFDASELESERYEQMWVFVRPRYFARPEMRRYLRPASWNAELRYRTTPNFGPNSTPGAGYERFAREKRRYYSNRGLRLEDVERLAKRPVTRVRVAPVDEPYLRKRDRFDDWRERGNREVKIYRPERRRTEEAVNKRPRGKAGMPWNASKESARGLFRRTNPRRRPSAGPRRHRLQRVSQRMPPSRQRQAKNRAPAKRHRPPRRPVPMPRALPRTPPRLPLVSVPACLRRQPRAPFRKVRRPGPQRKRNQPDPRPRRQPIPARERSRLAPRPARSAGMAPVPPARRAAPRRPHNNEPPAARPGRWASLRQNGQ